MFCSNNVFSSKTFVGLRVEQLEEVLSKYELCFDRVPEFFDILDKINDGQNSLEKGLIERCASWTGRTEEIYLLMNEEGDRIFSLEQVMLLSSILEFSLGNVSFYETTFKA